MKKLSLLVAPLMTIFLLASCGADNPGPTPVDTTYTLTFNCENCKAFDENENELSTIEITIPSDHSKVVYQSFYFKRIEPYKTPLKSSISVINTDSFEPVEFEYHNGIVTVPVIGNLAINAHGTQFNKDLENSSWTEIREISNTGHPEEFFAIGDTKKVQLEHQDSKGDGTDVISDSELYQTVRIIGFNQDEDNDGNAIGITFEFADLISDAEGYSLASIWNDSNNAKPNSDYTSSTIHNNLVNTTKGTAVWYTKNAEKRSETYKNSVFNMLPDSLSSQITPSNKTILFYDNEADKYAQKSATVSLFLLCPKEMGWYDPYEGLEYDVPIYQYYEKFIEKKNPIRIKAQLKGSEGALSSCSKILSSDLLCGKEGSCYAGYNSKTSNCGGIPWLRTPNPTTSYSAGWIVKADGDFIGTYHVTKNAYAVAPAFCI